MARFDTKKYLGEDLVLDCVDQGAWMVCFTLHVLCMMNQEPNWVRISSVAF